MKPILYPAGETEFSSNGLGRLSDAIECTVTEERNGEYELEIVHLLDDTGKWHRLKEGYIIRAPVPSATTPQVALAYKAMSEGKPAPPPRERRNSLLLL